MKNRASFTGIGGRKSGGLYVTEYSQNLSYMTYDFNLDNDLDIKPIAKNEQHFKKWSSSYPFYENVNKERVILYGAA